MAYYNPTNNNINFPSVEKTVRDLQILRRERLPGYDFPIRVRA